MLIAPVDYILDSCVIFTALCRILKKTGTGAGSRHGFNRLQLASVANIEPEKGRLLIPMHLPTFISRGFEKVYWPSYQALINDLVEKGFTVKCAFERKYEHLFDYLQDCRKIKLWPW